MHAELFSANAEKRKNQLQKMVVSEVQSTINYIIVQKFNILWLQCYDAAIKDVVKHCMNSPQCLVAGVQVLIELWHYIYYFKNYAAWTPIIQMGSALAQDKQATHKIIDELKAVLNKPNVPRELKSEFLSALDLTPSDLGDLSVEDKRTLWNLMNTYLSILDRLAYDLDAPLNATLLNPIFQTAEKLNEPNAFAALYASLAYAYAARVDYNKAIWYANISYNFYQGLGDKSGMAHAANARALAHRMMRLPATALAEYKIAIKNQRNNGAIPRERLYLQEAGIHFEFDNFEAAIATYQKCLNILDERAIHQQYHSLIYAKCVQGIALCQIWLGHFWSAIENLNKAEAVCIELKAEQMLVNNMYMRGFLEGRRKNLSTADKQLQTALMMAGKLTNEATRTDLQKSILHTIETLALTGGGSKLHNTVYR